MSRAKKKPSPAQLESEANAILAKDDREMLKAMADNVQALRDSWEQARLPNDPEHAARLQAVYDARNQIANHVKEIHIIPEKGKTYLGVTMVNPADHAAARETAMRMADHFEATLRNHQDPADKTKSADYTQVREPAHEFGREKRSLPR